MKPSGLNFQGSGEFQQVNVQDFNQGINKFNTPSSTNRPTNNGQFNQNGGQFNQNGGQFNQNGGQFNQNGGQFNQNGGQFNQLQQRPSGNQFSPRPGNYKKKKMNNYFGLLF